jgi:hypothetical protein
VYRSEQCVNASLMGGAKAHTFSDPPPQTVPCWNSASTQICSTICVDLQQCNVKTFFLKYLLDFLYGLLIVSVLIYRHLKLIVGAKMFQYIMPSLKVKLFKVK